MKRGWLPHGFYGHVHASMPIACVDLVVGKGSQVLIVKRKNQPLRGSWFIPGGRILRNETVWHAAERIAKEEVGLKVRILEILGWDESFFSSDPFGHGKGTHTINIVARSMLVKGNVKLDKQHSEFRWIERENASEFEGLHCRAESIINCGRRYEIDGIDEPFEMVKR